MDRGKILSMPSLAPQWKLAESFYGERGAKRLTIWLEQQIERALDSSFSRLFTDHITLEGIGSSEYNHRILQSTSGALLGGIRFFGGDVSHPFVEVIAHSFDRIESLLSDVRSEWSAFAPKSIRMTAASGTLPSPDAILDISIHAARYSEMEMADGRVCLQPLVGLEDACRMVSERYRELSQECPKLAENISPASANELRECSHSGRLFGVALAEDELPDPVGLIAIRLGRVDWIEGHEVVEEVVISEQSGHGIAVSAQKALATLCRGEEPEQLLVGTIDRLNHASRKTAERAGRVEALRKVFIPL